MVIFIADYDNLRFDFMIFIFLEWFGKDLGTVWERLCTPAKFSARLDSLDSISQPSCKIFWSERFSSGGCGN